MNQLGIVSLNRRHTTFDPRFPHEYLGPAARVKSTFICCSVWQLFERQSFTSPMKKARRGWEFLTRAVKHLWLPLLSACLGLFPPAAKCLYWPSSCLRLLYRLAGNRTLVKHRSVCAVCSAFHTIRNATWDPSLLRKLSEVISFASHTSMNLPNYHTLKGLFVFASRCNHVAWVTSLLHFMS